MVRRYRSRPAAWVIALLAVTPPAAYRLAAQDGVAIDAGAGQSPQMIAEQGTPPPTPAQELPEVLARGPVHEAFAEPVNMQAQEGLVVPVPPPPDVVETPPAERPGGEQFAWVPGYWAWDAERNGYIWVSGCWRITPPNMYWVPGYWTQAAGGWQWVAGFWAPVDVQEIEYLPAPPSPDEVQPPGPAPDADYIWVPPCWYPRQGQYIRRPGFWLAARPDWVWMPSHYTWTPRGYVMVEGHWDYPMEGRGVLFAPVSFPPSVYGQADVSYSPSAVIDAGVLTSSLFAYPRYSHYYFGDYYDDDYIRIGIYPWFDQVRIAFWCDPIFGYDRWRYRRGEPRWEERERHDYDQRRAQRDLRPARTFREQETRLAAVPVAQRQNLQVVQPLSVVVANKTLPVRFQKINTDVRRKIAQQALAESKAHADRHQGQAVAGRTASPPPAEHKRPELPFAEHKAPATPFAVPNVTVTPAPVHRERVTPPPEPRGPVIPPVAHKEKVTPPPTHVVPVTPPPTRVAPVMPPPEPIQHFEPKRTEGRHAVPAPVQPAPSVPNTFGEDQSNAEVQHAVARAHQSRQAVVPAAPPASASPRTYTPPAPQPKNTPRSQPAYTPPAPQPAPQPRNAPEPKRTFTPPQALPTATQPTLFPDAAPDSDTKKESSRGHASMRH